MHRLCLGLALALCAACAPVQPVQFDAPDPERAAFVDGAQWGCAGMVSNMAKVLLVPMTDEVGDAILLMCRNYATALTRVVWDTGLSGDAPDDAPQLWTPVKPT